MAKLQKLTDKHRFLLQVQKAVADYDRQLGGERYSDPNLDDVARSAAIQFGLSYDGANVDPAIVAAIRITSDAKNSEDAQKKARDDAWEAYRKHS